MMVIAKAYWAVIVSGMALSDLHILNNLNLHYFVK